jgi:hypothetical protein
MYRTAYALKQFSPRTGHRLLEGVASQSLLSSASVATMPVASLWSSSSSSSLVEAENSPVPPLYVHHVSKSVLEYLQETRSDWLVEEGLDRGLRVISNGTFVLHYPSRPGFDAGRIWCVLIF